jgi:hypothetical protein
VNYETTMDQEREAPLDQLEAADDDADGEPSLLGAPIPSCITLTLTSQ